MSLICSIPNFLPHPKQGTLLERVHGGRIFMGYQQAGREMHFSGGIFFSLFVRAQQICIFISACPYILYIYSLHRAPLVSSDVYETPPNTKKTFLWCHGHRYDKGLPNHDFDFSLFYRTGTCSWATGQPFFFATIFVDCPRIRRQSVSLAFASE